MIDNKNLLNTLTALSIYKFVTVLLQLFLSIKRLD